MIVQKHINCLSLPKSSILIFPVLIYSVWQNLTWQNHVYLNKDSTEMQNNHHLKKKGVQKNPPPKTKQKTNTPTVC